MFAPLDDVESQVALFVRDAAGEAAEAIVADQVVVVRGRVDHKGRDETSLVVSEAEAFEPSSDEVSEARRRAEERSRPQRLVLHLDAAQLDPRLIGELKAVFSCFPGGSEVLLEMDTRQGRRMLRFGPDYRVEPSPALRAELDQLLGSRAIAA
jgi:DNA polymerase-3 subunit alpha